MIKFYQPITTISGMIGSVTSSILNILEQNFPKGFFNHIYVDTRLASVEQRNRKKRIVGYKLPALALRPNFLLEETLIDATEIIPFSEVLLDDRENNVYIESIIERVKFSIEIKMKLESRLKTWDVMGWLKRAFMYKAPAVIENVYLDSIIPSNLAKDLLKAKGLDQTISDIDKLIFYMNSHSSEYSEFFRRYNVSIGKNTLIYRHPRNIMYTINDLPQADFSKKGMAETENFISLEMSVETWFPVGYRTNFQNDFNGSYFPEEEHPLGHIDYPDDYTLITELDEIYNPTIKEPDPFFPPNDLYLPSDEDINLDDLFNVITEDNLKDSIKLYIKNYNTSKDQYYNFDSILSKDSTIERMERAYEDFIEKQNNSKIGLHKAELSADITLDFLNGRYFRTSSLSPLQSYGTLMESISLPAPDEHDLDNIYNPPSHRDIITTHLLSICNIPQSILNELNNDLTPDPTDEEIYDNEDQHSFLLNPNNTLLDYYLRDDDEQIILTFYGPMSHPNYDSHGNRKLFSTYFVSDINSREDKLNLYDEFSSFYRSVISYMLNISVDFSKVFKIYLYSRNGNVITPTQYTMNWETLTISFNKPQINMTYNLAIYINLVQMKQYISSMLS
ncbi:MAG: hypothetical protein WC175_05270 [Candidatus Dojkabacteria bacterium]